MKKLLVLLILISTAATAQTGNIKYDQLTGSNLNDVTWKVDRFASRKMRLTKKGDQAFQHNSDTEVIVTQVLQKFNDPDRTITINYKTKPDGHFLFVNDFSVTGDQELLIEFYVKFWKTDIELESNEGGLLASSRFLNDQIELYAGTLDKIVVRPFKM